MKPFVCPICGGDMHIVIESGLMVCDSCGTAFDADLAYVRKYGRILQEADRLMQHNTTAGCEDAIRLTASIPFVSGAREKQAECEKRLKELQEKAEHRRALARREDEKNTKIGIALLILTVFFAAAAIAGVVYLIILWSKGQLSRKTIIIIASVVVIIAVLALLSNNRSRN